MSGITTHVLDTARGKPAAGLVIRLERRGSDGAYVTLGQGRTDNDGRLRTLLPSGVEPEAGVFRMTFDTGAYFAALGIEGFYPEAVVTFEIRDPAQHYHVPLLLSPFAFSTYRGS